MNNLEECKHEWQLVWLSDDLEGFRCKKCGYETVDFDYESYYDEEKIMIDFELIEDEDLLHEYKCLFDTLTNSGLSDAEEHKLEKQIDVCEIEILNRMNKRKCQNESN